MNNFRNSAVLRSGSLVARFLILREGVLLGGPSGNWGCVSVHFREDQSLLKPYVYQQLRHHRKRRFVGGAPRERYSQSVVSAHNLAQALLNVVGFKPLLDRMDRNTKLMMLKE